MLVMSRRQDEKVVFPGLGIVVTLLGVRGNTARLGVDAPRDVKILREEVADRCPPPHSVRQDQHAIRNVLNSVNLFAMVYQKQMDAGLTDDAATTFIKLVDYLEKQTQSGRVDFTVESESAEPVSGRVMVVEDDDDQRELLTSLLAMQGLDVAAHDNGRTALDELRRGNSPNVVLLDWAMPQFGGEWLVPKIRGEFGSQSPKLFVLSGTESVRTAQREGVDAWLGKPLNQEALLARIRAACPVA
ncbi:MAG: carbon storage regulator [Planctomycetaceae bacterium]